MTMLIQLKWEQKQEITFWCGSLATVEQRTLPRCILLRMSTHKIMRLWKSNHNWWLTHMVCSSHVFHCSSRWTALHVFHLTLGAKSATSRNDKRHVQTLGWISDHADSHTGPEQGLLLRARWPSIPAQRMPEERTWGNKNIVIQKFTFKWLMTKKCDTKTLSLSFRHFLTVAHVDAARHCSATAGASATSASYSHREEITFDRDQAARCRTMT